MEIETIGKYIRILTQKNIEISTLRAGGSTKVQIELFSFGFMYLDVFDRIIITTSAPEIKTMKRIVIASIAWYMVDVITVFFNDEGSYDGYTLYSPEYSADTYLIDKDGRIVHRWKSSYIQGVGYQLLENGNLVRPCLKTINPIFIVGGATGRVEMSDWNGTLLWGFDLSTDERCIHHEIETMPNGNVLMIAWELKTFNEAVAAGRNPLFIPAGSVWACYIIEVEPILPYGGNIVWEWHVWDHLIQDYDLTKDNYGYVKDHPELIDINYGIPFGIVDLNHINSVEYNEEFDQILLSSHVQNEIWIIDHSTTTNEAAGHTGGRYGKGGDLLYRWGNPEAYRAGNDEDQIFFGQHDARWIKDGCPGEGNILVFNNGFARPWTFYSSVIEIEPPVDSLGNYYLEHGSAYGPEEPVWIYTAKNPTDFFASIQSGAQRLPNGNTLICDGPGGKLFEVTPEKEIVWKYVNIYPNLINTRMATLNFYPPDYDGFGDFTIKPATKALDNKHNFLIYFLNNFLKNK